MLDILRRIWRSPSGRIGLVATLIVVLGGLAGAADRDAYAEPDRRRSAPVAAFGRAIGSAPTISAATSIRAASTARGSRSAWRSR